LRNEQNVVIDTTVPDYQSACDEFMHIFAFPNTCIANCSQTALVIGTVTMDNI